MHARKFILFKFIVRDAEVFPDINLILHIRIILFYSLLFLRYMLQPLRIKFTVLSCFETNIYLRLFLRGLLRTHANKAVTDAANKLCKQTFYY